MFQRIIHEIEAGADCVFRGELLIYDKTIITISLVRQQNAIIIYQTEELDTTTINPSMLPRMVEAHANLFALTLHTHMQKLRPIPQLPYLKP